MKNFLFLTSAIFALSSSAYAVCPDAKTISSVVGRALNYDDFKGSMIQYGGLNHITSNGNFHLLDWKRFQKAIAGAPLTAPHVASQYCQYTSNSSEGTLTVNLKKQ